MKVKFGYSTGYEDKIKGVVDLDSLDITDLNFKNATDDTLYFFNLTSKLTYSGELKIRGIWPSFNKYEDHEFVYIMTPKEIDESQKEFECHKNLVKQVMLNMKKTDNISGLVLEHNNWQIDESADLSDMYDNYICYYRMCPNAFITLTTGACYTNSGRKWLCHVDNEDRDSIGNIEIDTITQFNDLMKILDIDYTLYNI